MVETGVDYLDSFIANGRTSVNITFLQKCHWFCVNF